MIRCVRCNGQYYPSEMVWYGMIMPMCRRCHAGHAVVERERVPTGPLDDLDCRLALWIGQAMLEDS